MVTTNLNNITQYVKIHKSERHSTNSFKHKLLLKSYSMPFFNKIKIVKCLLCKAYNIPLSTSINKGFYCSAPLLNIGGNIGL